MIEELQLQCGAFSTRCLVAGPKAAEVALLLHDGAWGGASGVTWGDVIPRLATRFRVIAPDMLGFGGTDKAVFLDRSPYEFRIAHLFDVLAALGATGKVHVVGSSFGGSVALQMLATHSDRLASVVSISGTGGPWRTDFGRAQLGQWDGSRDDLLRIVDLLVDATGRFDMEAQVEGRHRWAIAPGHYRAMMAPSVAQPELLKAQGAPEQHWPAVLAGKSTPVLLVAGARDRLVESDWTDKLAAHIGRLKVCVLDAKHSPNIDDPEGTAALLEEWLQGPAGT